MSDTWYKNICNEDGAMINDVEISLDGKQEKFCQYRAEGLNSGDSAIKAGYSSRAYGTELDRKFNIKGRIDYLKEQIQPYIEEECGINKVALINMLVENYLTSNDKKNVNLDCAEDKQETVRLGYLKENTKVIKELATLIGAYETQEVKNELTINVGGSEMELKKK